MKLENIYPNQELLELNLLRNSDDTCYVCISIHNHDNSINNYHVKFSDIIEFVFVSIIRKTMNKNIEDGD